MPETTYEKVKSSDLKQIVDQCRTDKVDSISLLGLKAGTVFFHDLQNLSECKTAIDSLMDDPSAENCQYVESLGFDTSRSSVLEHRREAITNLIYSTEILVLNALYRETSPAVVNEFLSDYFESNIIAYESGTIDLHKFELNKGWLERLYMEAMCLREITGVTSREQDPVTYSRLLAIQTLTLQDIKSRKAGITAYISPNAEGTVQLFPLVIVKSRGRMVTKYAKTGKVPSTITALSKERYLELAGKVDQLNNTNFRGPLAELAKSGVLSFDQYWSVIKIFAKNLGFQFVDDIGGNPTINPAKRMVKATHYLLQSGKLSLNGLERKDISRIPLIVFYTAPDYKIYESRSEDLNKV